MAIILKVDSLPFRVWDASRVFVDIMLLAVSERSEELLCPSTDVALIVSTELNES